MSWIHSALPTSPAYEAIERRLEQGYVVVDGGVATELERGRASEARARREPWGVWALYGAQTEVLTTHRRYVAAGCDVLSTNSWAILESAESWGAGGPPAAWKSAADAALRLARKAPAQVGRAGDCAVAFCINGDLRGSRALGALELLTWSWRDQAPDLVMFETLTELPGDRLAEAVDMVRELGLPVWVSMRRAAGGMASVDGEVAPDDAPDRLADAIDELERRGVGAVLVNCVPRELVADSVSALSAATDLPIGCLPNLGHPAGAGWQRDEHLPPEEFADEALVWIESGARIVGGCCGVGPEHIVALERTRQRAVAWSARGA
jgi:S-methylmethionine-dependent homocysteine/selenocysteine methylase